MEQIYKILEEIRPEFDFKESNDYIEDGLLDSFDIVTVVSEIEAAFGILIDLTSFLRIFRILQQFVKL